MLGEQNSHRASLWAIVQTVKFVDLNCRLSDTPMWSSDRQIRRFGVQSVLIDYWECCQIVQLLLLLSLLLIVIFSGPA